MENNKDYDIVLGQKINEYLRKYKGQPTYKDIAAALQYGFHLDEEIDNTLDLNVKKEEFNPKVEQLMLDLEESTKKYMEAEKFILSLKWYHKIFCFRKVNKFISNKIFKGRPNYK